MNVSYLLCLCIALRIGSSSGLRCWNCENVRSPAECIKKGYSQQCRITDVCQTEVRYSEGWDERPIIRTACKQKSACVNNHVQNPRFAWNPTQCNWGHFNSVCRCCCEGTHCNRRDLLCAESKPTTAPITAVTARKTTTPKCPDLGSLRNGKITCTDGQNLGSSCSFQCTTEGYSVIPSNATITECVRQNGTARWSKKKPCCSSQCPPNAKKDIVFVMDSSFSVQRDGWETVKSFVINVTRQFVISDEYVKVAVLTYGSDINETSQILFGDYQDVSDLEKKVQRLQWLRGATYTGKALNHTKHSLLQDKQRNREDISDMIILITDGEATDKDNTIDVAEKLRNQGVKIAAVGISVTGDDSALLQELEKLTGDKNAVIKIENIAGINRLLRDQLSKLICEFSCESE